MKGVTPQERNNNETREETVLGKSWEIRYTFLFGKTTKVDSFRGPTEERENLKGVHPKRNNNEKRKILESKKIRLCITTSKNLNKKLTHFRNGRVQLF